MKKAHHFWTMFVICGALGLGATSSCRATGVSEGTGTETDSDSGSGSGDDGSGDGGSDDGGTGGTGGGTGGTGGDGGTTGGDDGGTSGDGGAFIGDPDQGGDTGDGSCDSLPSCDQCMMCALQADCADEFAACQNDPDCAALMNCLGGCADGACIQQCFNDYPGGPVFDALVYCQFCDACPTICDAASMGIQC
jgi:hypothetical protein